MNLQRALPQARTALRASSSTPIPSRPVSRISSASLTTNASLSLQRRTPTATPAGSLIRNTAAAAAARFPQLSLQSSSRQYASSSSPPEGGPLKKTPLYDLHVAHGAKMVPFGGFAMPVQYASQGVAASHHFTRSHASLFDVGHMVQHRFEGPGAAAFLQRVTPGSIAALPRHGSTLSALLWPGTGGIVDDTIVTKLGDDQSFYVVTNAACRDKDLAYLGEELQKWREASKGHSDRDVSWEVQDGWGLVALQGPLAEAILAEVVASPEEAARLRELYFGQSRFVALKAAAAPVLVSRGGYTGEDGFEISIAPADAVAVAEALLSAAGPERLQLAGLGARDSLRLEAGMCLYGHDLDDTTTPAEAALGWIVGRDRRHATDPAEGAFHGAEVVLPQLTPRSKGGAGVERRRAGLVVEGAPAREGAEILDPATGDRIGVVTSGCPSPTLGKNIAMGYLRDGLHKAGTEVEVVVRGRPRKAVVTKMPFVPTKYWKGDSGSA
ncbi:Aminomethyltransferase, mitochondrial [Diatrype stigma]|uniref:Aminomethyltransferase n=1 Tax=Diatrype stigma TaxID=117547 RepID=A0AAN9USM8_9PEZI